MSISKYFKAVPDASITFDGATIRLRQAMESSAKVMAEDMEAGAAGSIFLKDIVLQADEGEVVLVLGKPTSSLFKVLFDGHQNLSYSPEGSIRFKANPYREYSVKCPQQIIYNNEEDVHFPYLTVEQTIDFALSCKFEISKAEREQLRDALLTEFGLYHVKKTFVGNDYVRGISGGERKRISIIETFIANGSLYLWDNSTKGLDSSTALDFLSILQSMAKATKSVNFVKISQASDAIVSKFDKILMLSDSYQVFYGTVDECLEYFNDTLGIQKNPNDCIIEYLTSVLNFQFKVPSSVISESTSTKTKSTTKATINSEQDLHYLWTKSPNYQIWKQRTSQSVRGSNDELDSDDITPVFNIKMTRQIEFCIRRAFQRILGDKSFLISQAVSVVVQALVIGSLFYNIPLTTIGSFSRGSLVFFSLLFYTFLSLADLPTAFQRQKVIDKHAKLHFYHRWVETFATTIYDYTFKLLLIIIFTIILYFLAHFQYNASRFFIFLLFLGVYNFTMVSLFSLTALIAPTLSIANLLAGILLLAIAMYASYVIYLADMHPWFVWIAYLNPAMFAMEAILSNELYDLKLDCTQTIVPRGPTYEDISFQHKACAWQGATLGNSFVRGRDYLKNGLRYTYHHVWRNFGILLGFLFFFLFCSLVAAEYVKPLFTRENMEMLQRKYRRWMPSRTYNKETNDKIGLNDDVYVPNGQTTPTSSSVSSIAYMPSEIKPKLTKGGMNAETSVQSQNHIISWKNITYTVGDKRLINDVSGYMASGLTALMGESGAGKSTLLNILSKRTESGVVTGDILIDGKPLTDENAFKRSIGFVQQQDVHLELLTVKESLEISCVLRGDGDRDYLNTISELLNLRADKRVADLSPTERKLLSIGVELVTKPSLLLLLDEPTSGLDSQAALTIVQFLKKLSLQGQAILCTIHQPSKSVISYFDNIFLLKRGGECVYFGPTNNACDYFTSREKGLTYDNKSGNPADFVIDVVGSVKVSGDDVKDEYSVEPKVDVDWRQKWKDSPDRNAILANCLELEEKSRGEGIDFTQSLWNEQSYVNQLLLIIKRQYICTKRDKIYVASKFLLNGGAGLFIGFSFWKTKYNINGLQNSIFLCFMSLCVSSPLINQVQDKALASKEVYLAREASSQTYHWSVLLLAQLIVELPLAVSSSTLFFLCCYFCCGFDFSAHIAGVFYLNYILFSAYYLSFGLWLIYVAPDLQTAAVFVAFLYSFTASFCGVMQPYSLFPGFWKFMYRVSPYTYFVDTFVSLLLHDRPVKCDIGELVPTAPLAGESCGEFMQAFVNEFGGKINNPTSYTVCAYCTYNVGDDFLKEENMSYAHRWRNFGIQCAFVGFNIAAMFIGFYMNYVRNVWPLIFRRINRVMPSRVCFEKGSYK